MGELYDTVIAGGGLAGALAALFLSRRGPTLLLDAGSLAAGASGIGAGLVNPLMSRQARPAWRAPEALQALDEALRLAEAGDLFRRSGVLRPAPDERQADRFREAAARDPAGAGWLPPDEAAARFPHVRSPLGALLVRSGGHLPIPALVDACARAAARQGADVRTAARLCGWEETPAEVRVRVGPDGEVIRTARLVLALGAGFADFPETAALALHRVKGQVVRVARPAGLPDGPALAGAAYVVPGADDVTLGSSYEHRFDTLDPSPEQTRLIRARAAALVPLLARAPVIEARAGVRVTVPGLRLPMLGPLPGRRRVWIFTGLGSKGLLVAPLLARALGGYLEDPGRIPPELHPGLRKR